MKASCILLKGDHHERHQMVEAEVNASDDSLCDRYLSQVDTVFTSGCAKGMFYSIARFSFVAICVLTIITSILTSSSLDKIYWPDHGLFGSRDEIRRL